MTNRILWRLMILVAATLAYSAAGAQTNQEKLDITAFAVNMSNIGTGGSTTVQIRIDSWSSPEERKHLIETMIEKNADALLKELQKTPSHGRFSIPGLRGPDPHQLRLGYDLHYTWQTALPEGGRKIVIATDDIGFAEAREQPRTIDYPFTLFEIRVDKNGEGQGKMAVATRLTSTRRRTRSSWKTTPASRSLP